jgi:hypothetical protein
MSSFGKSLYYVLIVFVGAGFLSDLFSVPAGAGEPQHGLVQAVVNLQDDSTWCSYQEIKKAWSFLKIDTRGEEGCKLCMQSNKEYNDILLHDPMLPWIRANGLEEANPNHVIWISTKNIVAGYRSYAIIRGRYTKPRPPGPGAGGPGEVRLPPPWFTKTLDLDLDADTARDGIDNLTIKRKDRIEDPGEEDAPGLDVKMGGTARLLLRKVMPKTVPQGKIVIRRMFWTDTPAGENPPAGATSGQLDIFYDDGPKKGKSIFPKGVDGQTLDESEDLWGVLHALALQGKEGLYMNVIGRAQGPVMIEVEYSKGESADALIFIDRVRATVAPPVPGTFSLVLADQPEDGVEERRAWQNSAAGGIDFESVTATNLKARIYAPGSSRASKLIVSAQEIEAADGSGETLPAARIYFFRKRNNYYLLKPGGRYKLVVEFPMKRTNSSTSDDGVSDLSMNPFDPMPLTKKLEKKIYFWLQLGTDGRVTGDGPHEYTGN